MVSLLFASTRFEKIVPVAREPSSAGQASGRMRQRRQKALTARHGILVAHAPLVHRPGRGGVLEPAVAVLAPFVLSRHPELQAG